VPFFYPSCCRMLTALIKTLIGIFVHIFKNMLQKLLEAGT